MSIGDNPIFLTQKRLTHRSGVMAAVLIAGILGLSLFAGLYVQISNRYPSPEREGKMFYGWIVALEILVLVWGAFGRVSRALADDRKAGLWDSNRLTPMKASDLVTGYWFGSALRELYMGAVLAAIGLVMVLMSQLNISLWLGTQVLILTTALFFGLLGVLAGLAFQQPKSGVLLLLGFAFVYGFSILPVAQPKALITNFLLPIYAIANLFTNRNDFSVRDWMGYPEIFGVSIHPVLLCVSLQFAVGWFLWRAAVRKTANPFQPLLQRREAVALFALVMAVQHGLIWAVWRGHFDSEFETAFNYEQRLRSTMLPVVHGGTMLLGIIIVAFASPEPESVRVEAMRTGRSGLGLVFARSSVSLSLALAAVAAAALCTQFVSSSGSAWKIYAAAVGNLLGLFVIVALLLEFCRLRFRRRAIGFVTLWLFVGCILPFILAAVFSATYVGRYSLLVPGIGALSDSDSEDISARLFVVVAHFALAFCLFLLWRSEWRKLLEKAVAAAATSP